MTRRVAGLILCFAGHACFVACGVPSAEEPVRSVAESAVLLKPPKHFSGEPEYPVEGVPAEEPGRRRVPDEPPAPSTPPGPEPCDPPPVEEPPDDPPMGNDPRERDNPHHESESGHSSIPHGGPNAGDGIGHHGQAEASRGNSKHGDKYVTRLSPQQWKDICNTACEVAAVAGCVAVHGACVAGAVWSFGGILIPCEWAVLAACAGSAAAGGACKAKCDEP